MTEAERLRLLAQARQRQLQLQSRPPAAPAGQTFGDPSLVPTEAALFGQEYIMPETAGEFVPASLMGSSPVGGPVAQFGAGSQSGIARGLGFPVDAVTGGINALGGFTGAWGPIEQPFLGSESIDAMISPLRQNVEEPQNAWDRFARRTGEEVGAGAAMLPLALSLPAGQVAPLAVAASDTAASLGAGVGASIANEQFPGNPYADVVGALLGGIPAGMAVARQFDETPLDILRQNDVSVDDLRAQASALYDQARANGITASPQQTQGLQATIRGIATNEGVITPAGRVAESYPRIRDILNMVDDFAQGSMDPSQMQAVRRTMQAAAASADGSERRIGTMLLREFDDFVAPLAPEFSQASALYRRAMLGQGMDQMRELAESRSGQFSGSGLENALRTEYRGMDRDIIRGRVPGISADQIGAVQGVARGTTGSNIARNLGRAAPTGVVSAGIGGGMPFLIGNALGGPGVGAALGATTMGVGAASRNIATRMGLRNAEIAELLMRSADGRMPNGSQMISPVIAALLGGRVAADGLKE